MESGIIIHIALHLSLLQPFQIFGVGAWFRTLEYEVSPLMQLFLALKWLSTNMLAYSYLLWTVCKSGGGVPNQPAPRSEEIYAIAIVMGFGFDHTWALN